tara:strand:+ start:244 stop:444 length:201 start_codon:yes stop_codon:yes gene_type:complete
MGKTMTSENIIRKKELQKLTNSLVRIRRDVEIMHNALTQLIDKEIQDLEDEDRYWNQQADLEKERA